MKWKISGLSLIGVATFLIFIAACGGSDTIPPAIPSEPTTPPTVQAPTPTPTAVPELEREVALDFAIGHRTISQDWEQFHADFDGWREGLIVCDASSVEVTFIQFAGRFAAITEAARGLPRDPSVRELGRQGCHCHGAGRGIPPSLKRQLATQRSGGFRGGRN